MSKFSAIALGPIFLVLLTICVLRGAPWPCRIGKLPAIGTRLGRAAAGAGILLLVAFACWGAIWAVYGFRYLPSATPGWRFSFEDSTREEMPVLTRLVHEVDKRRLLPNVYSQGFLLQQFRGAGRDAFLSARIRKNGWWYYFLFAFLIKTPVSLILFLFGGLIFCALKWQVFYENALFVLVPICLYMGAAMASGLNIGLRHILPIYPFVILLAALCGAELLRAKRLGVVGLLGVLCLFWLFEVARVFPHDLAFFNSFIGGPQNGYKYLADSNIDWGQDLEGVKRWMDKQGVKQISLDYFGFADPSYYGIQYKTIGRGTEHFIPPRLPGYVAVSVTLLDGIGLTSADRSFYRALIARQPSAVIGYSIRIYWANERWWPSSAPAEQTTGTTTKTRVLSRVGAQGPGLSQAAQ